MWYGGGVVVFEYVGVDCLVGFILSLLVVGCVVFGFVDFDDGGVVGFLIDLIEDVGDFFV